MTPEDGDADDRKSVKTGGSERVIPLHPTLVELGFFTFVDRQREAGLTRLFPALKADQLEVHTKEASRRTARIIDRYVSKDPRLVFHSFRHSFKDLCREADIPKEAHDQLTGHAPADVGGGYGLGRAIANLAAHLRRIDLSFIDWSSIVEASQR